MNAFLARGAMVIQDWCHRNFHSAEYGAASSHATSGKGNWFCFFSASRSAPVPMIQRPTIIITANTATGAAMDVNRVKPSIVRVVRVRRRRWAGKSRFPGEPIVRPIANS
jgi:hypothetical protein